MLEGEENSGLKGISSSGVFHWLKDLAREDGVERKIPYYEQSSRRENSGEMAL